MSAGINARDALTSRLEGIPTATLGPRPPDRLAPFGRFSAEALSRLQKGRQSYGDRSFSHDPRVLIRELQDEALDLAGWGFILWSRLEAMTDALDALEEGTRP